MADEKNPKKPLSDEALARIKGMGTASASGKQHYMGGKMPKFSGKAQGNSSNASNKRGMR
jgi:hypothetical protein